MNNVQLSFDDVRIVPRYSTIRSRKDVSTDVSFLDMKLTVPIISSNMDTVTGVTMAKSMWDNGGVGCLHRFMSIEQNVRDFLSVGPNCIVSVGVGPNEVERAIALIKVGANKVCIDVAHGASDHVVEIYDKVRCMLPFGYIIVGNFATGESILDFERHMKSRTKPDAYKIGIGPGSACKTSVQTGCGLPALATIIDCQAAGVTQPLIADGGIRSSGDMAKALAAGASMVMLGGLLAGTDESPGELHRTDFGYKKRYRGSASKESYQVQGKESEWRTFEGDSFEVPATGPLKDVINNLTAGVRSACSYVGANNLTELREKAKFVQVTANGVIEADSHGNKGSK